MRNGTDRNYDKRNISRGFCESIDR